MRLAHYASRFSCVEVDSTFYGVPKKETVRAWAERTPGRFRFALKVPGIVTHGAQGSRPILEDVLKDKEGRLADFLETAELLGDKLGPILFQFPYFRVREMEKDDFFDRLEATLDRLPADRCGTRKDKPADSTLLVPDGRIATPDHHLDIPCDATATFLDPPVRPYRAFP